MRMTLLSHPKKKTPAQIRTDRIAFLTNYKKQVNADDKKLLRIAMQRWHVTRRTAKEYIFSIGG